MTVLRHARLRGPRRSPHRPGRITPDNVLDNDPRRRTVCGAEPTSNDLDNRSARSKSGAKWLTCPECTRIIAEQKAAESLS